MSDDNKYMTKEEFDAAIKKLEKKLKKANDPPKEPRKETDYNIFVRDYMAKLKKETPDMDNKVAFKKCAEEWNKKREATKTANK